ncbi:MAG TPA: hypothetical protein VKA63_03635, partial [Candidatus Krumholzibacteria bacterium]|nr:hypothetical protein [Candidatus Krumholzibacteria bacterium]
MTFLDPVLFLLGTAISVAASILWARRHLARGFATALSAGIVGWVGLVVFVQLLLSLLGALRPVAVHGLVALVAAGIFWRLARSEKSAAAEETRLRRHLSLESGLVIAGAILIGFPLAQELIKSLARAPWDGDSLLYHLPLLLDSYIKGHTFDLASPFGHSPPYAELAGGWWWSAKWHDALMALQNPLAYLLLAFALVRLCETLAVRRGVAWLSVGVYFASARAIQRQATTQESDLWLAALLLAGFAWCLGPLDSRRDRLMAGLSLGLAMGCKMLGPVFVAIVLICSLLLRVTKQKEPSSLGRLLPVAGIALVLGAIPFVRNWILTQNPFYPGRVALFGLTIFPASSHSSVYGIDDFTSVWPYLRDSTQGWALYLHALKDHLGIFPLLGLVLAPLALLARPRRRASLALVASVVLMVAVLFTIPAFLKDPLGETPDWLREGYSLARFGLAPYSLLVVFVAFSFERIVRRFTAVAPTVEHAADRRSGAIPALLAGSFLAVACVLAALSPALQGARERARAERLQELTGCTAAELAAWRSLNRNLSHRELVVCGVYPWFFAGSDFSNYLRRPDSSKVPLAQVEIPGATGTLVYFETPRSAARLSGVLAELGIPPDTAATMHEGRFRA